MAEDQHPVQEQVGQDGDDAGDHGRPGFPGFPQRAGIDLNEGKGDQADQHDIQITDAVGQGAGQVSAVAFPLQVGHDEPLTEEGIDSNGEEREQNTKKDLIPEGITHALHIALAEKLRAENTGAAEPAEDREHMHHQDGIGDGSSGNRFGAQTADHYIVEQGHEGGNKLLDQNGNQQG